MKDEYGHFMGLIVEPENGEQVLQPILGEFVNIIQNLCQAENKFTQYVNNIIVENNELVFTDIDDINIRQDIINLCHQKITEKLIVPQNMGSGSAIRHRPLYFGVGEKPNSVAIKYTTLGEFNSMNVAMDQIKSL